MLGMTYTTQDRKNQWIARLAEETKVNSGFKAKQERLLRYLRVF